MDLLAWYNLIFVAPVGLAGVYLALSATGIGDLSGEADFDTDVDADVDTDFDHDVDLDMDHDVDLDLDADADMDFDHDVDVDMEHDLEVDLDADADADLDVDHDLDMDHEVEADADHDLQLGHDAEAESVVAQDVEGHDHLGAEHEVHEMPASAHEPSLLIRALSILGFGKVPVSILMTCLMVIFGATGLMANGLFETVVPWSWGPDLYFWPSLALALFASFGLTGSVARTLNRLMPTKETYAITEEELVGQVGVSVYGIPDGRLGPVNVKDTGGTVHQEMARGIDGAVPKGAEVLLVRYHREEDYYDVATSPISAIAGAAARRTSASEVAPDESARDSAAQDDAARRRAGARAADESTSSTRS